jgi:RimJ/RimL family protein N-acetyltransferase
LSASAPGNFTLFRCLAASTPLPRGAWRADKLAERSEPQKSSEITLEHEMNALGQPVGQIVHGWQPPNPPPRRPIAGRFCTLEPLDAARHARSLFDANAADAEGRAWTYLPYGPFPTRADYEAWAEGASASSDPLFFAVVRATDGRAVGIASFLRIDPRSGSIEIGHIHFSPLLQRTAAATEALFLMMREAFRLGYRRLEWKCDALNEASRRAAQRLGFSFEGIFRQARVVKGRNRDTAWYSIVDGEWPALEAAFAQWLDPANFDADGVQLTSLSALTAPLLHRRG